MVGKLSNWYSALNVYSRAQLVEVQLVEEFLGLLHYEFLGKWDDDLEIARKEFYQMKCCSLKKKDLDKHFQNTSIKFYQFRRIGNLNLK